MGDRVLILMQCKRRTALHLALKVRDSVLLRNALNGIAFVVQSDVAEIDACVVGLREPRAFGQWKAKHAQFGVLPLGAELIVDLLRRLRVKRLPYAVVVPGPHTAG